MTWIFYHSVILLLTFSGVRPAIVSKIGNDIRASSSGVDVRGATFLMNDQVEDEGILYAFSAFFRTDKAVRFQIWRPYMGSGTEGTYELVMELRTVPSVISQREDVYLASRLTEKCPRVYPGDRLGVYFEENPGAVSYTFDENHHTALAHTLKNLSDPHVLGDVVDFGTLLFPYDFSVSAYTDTNMTAYGSSSEVECPIDLFVPNEDIGSVTTTTTAPPTGAPGATGATGPRGQMGATGATGPTGEKGGEGDIGATGATGPHGSTGADGKPGAAGATGIMGQSGSAGATGPQGEKGEHGEEGPRGPVGPLGTMSPEAIAALMAEEEEEGMDMMILGLLVWIAVVTILLVILLIVTIIMSRRHKRDREILIARVPEHRHTDNRLSTRSYGDVPHEPWISTLKGQSHHDVSLSVVDSDGNDKGSLPSDYTVEHETFKGSHLNGAFSGSDDQLVTDSPCVEHKNY